MRQSNLYVILFAIGLTVVFGGALSLTSVGLKPLQDKQVELDTKKKILGAVMDISTIEDPNEILRIYSEKVKSMVVDINGNEVSTDDKGNPIVAEKVNIQKNYKLDPQERLYPVFMVMDSNNEPESYIFPTFGAGLWDWISGYVAFGNDLNTVKGVAFDHKGETPGLGARITEATVQSRYVGKEIFNDQGELVSITMVKGEGNTGLTEHQVDGMSGATITGKGVNAMLEKYLECYSAFIQKTKSEKTASL
ncbi:NADH:ubiquinone reductase (Na(+)-transporting) subunit C [Ekhidna sp. To15]|uniref:NADH:ubiquinone reductase (Na(+)-transporting) subunit C n=1 Tax=Ekhidna sp. To15 TaxID=3395267 RepID=UPI003F528864